MILSHIYDVDISKPLLPTILQPMMVTGDKLANRIGIRLKNGAQPYAPDGSCRGYVLRADGATVPILNGVVNGNEMYIDLPEAAYAVQGSVVISILCVTSSAVTTVFLGSGTVNRSQTDVVIDPGTVIDDISTLIQAIETAVASIPLDYSALSAAVTALQALPTDTVLYGNDQTLTDSQKTQARENIGAAGESDVADLKSAIGKVQGTFEPLLFDFASRSYTWVAAGINPSTGMDTESNTRIRSQSIPIASIASGFILEIRAGTNAKFKIAYYETPAANTFQSIDAEWTTSGNSQRITNPSENTFYIRILAGYGDDTVISDVDAAAEKVLCSRVIPKEFVEADTFNSAVYEFVDVAINNSSNKYWNLEGQKAVLTDISGQFYASAPIPVLSGEEYVLTAQQGNTDKTRIWAAVDDEYNIIAMCENLKGTTTNTIAFKIPENATLLVLTKQATASEQKLTKKKSALDILLSPLANKRLSLLGDSISAFAGTIPAGNDVYYTGSNSGVSSANQMWWKVLCDKTGMKPLIINGWSGSGVNWQTDSSHVNKVPMSDVSRCQGLHDGVVNPDIVLIAGGVNDYSYAEAAQNEPLEWNGKTAPGYTEPSAGKIVYNSFTEAYAAMIKKIQERYPDAIVVALSTWFTMRGTDNGYTLTHAVGSNVYTQQDYNDKIRYVAEQMHVIYLDVSNIGFNRNNFYPTFASDSSTIPTHPNKEGHAVMGKAIAERLPALVAAYLM